MSIYKIISTWSDQQWHSWFQPPSIQAPAPLPKGTIKLQDSRFASSRMPFFWLPLIIILLDGFDCMVKSNACVHTFPSSYQARAWFRDRTLQSNIALLAAGRARATDLPILTGSAKATCRSWNGCELARHVNTARADISVTFDGDR